MTLPFDVEEASAYLASVDDVLERVVSEIGECSMTLKSFEHPCQAITRAVVYQAISTKAAAKIHARIATHLGDDFTHEEVLVVEAETFRELGLSTTKSNAVRGIAQAMFDGDIPISRADFDDLTDQEVIDCLSAVKGIGEWTAQMILIFSLGRPDVLPDGDLGVREGYRLAYELDERPTPSELRKHGLLWSPFRTVAAWYLWETVHLAD